MVIALHLCSSERWIFAAGWANRVPIVTRIAIANHDHGFAHDHGSPTTPNDAATGRSAMEAGTSRLVPA
jgi:hypothetical protein